MTTIATQRPVRPLSDGPEWTFELLEAYHKEIARIAEQHGLSTYPNQIEIITGEQMLDAYSSIGMPIGYHHWSYGKKFIQSEQNYKRGQMGLAYEIVINSSPCIAYLMEENTLPMQALVIAHASYGHNSFFKNNYLFKTWTDATSIIDYLLFAKHYIGECEDKYGISEVEAILDSCHALMNYGVDRYKRPQQLSLAEERRRQKARESYLQTQVNELWKTLPRQAEAYTEKKQRYPSEPEENLLYFIEKNAPLLEPWQRELVRIVRKISQYFYPQKQTQVMNEGWATFWHYTISQQLYEEGLVTDSFMMEILHNHTNVVYQPAYNSPHYSGINPYALGFAIFTDLRRICEQPSAEDKAWFPDIAGSDWVKTLHFAMENFKDESFISQFLSPKVMRDLRLFGVTDEAAQNYLQISAIHDESGYQELRKQLSDQYNLANLEPNIQVYNVEVKGDRSLTLRYVAHNNIPLATYCHEVLKHVHRLWGFDVLLEQENKDGSATLISRCPKPKTEN